MGNNWTYAEFRKTVMTELEINRKKSVSLDVSRSDWRNIEDMLRWAESMGYAAENHEQSESVTVRRK